MNKITRRVFFEGAGAATIVPSAAFGDDAKPAFVFDGGDAAVQVNGKTIWTIRPTQIAPGARAQISTDAAKLRILGGRLPNALGFELDFDLSRLLGRWCITARWRFPAIGVSAASEPLTLAGPFCFRTSLRGRKLAALTEKLAGKLLQPPSKALLDLDADFHLSIDAAPHHFSVPGTRFAAHRLDVSPANNHITFHSGKAETTLELGRFRTFEVSLRTAGHVGGIVESGKLLLNGSFDLVLHNNRLHTATIPCETATVEISGASRSWKLSPRADFWRLNIPNASFDVTADEAGAATRRPVEIVENRHGVLLRFTADIRVHSSSLALAEVDRTRFDINGQSIRLALAEQLAAPASPLVAPVTTFALGIADAPFKLNLDKAKLRLWRGRDLFCLSFQFSQINLVVAKRIELVPMTDTEMRDRIALNPALRDEINSGKSAVEPVLVAEFPPQHIMERTFLRQNRPLPDAGDEVTPARLRELRRLGKTKEGQNLRDTIQKEKIEEENRLIPDGDPHPFKEFVEHWDGKPESALKKEFGAWIGPAGLFTLKGRREARRFAEARRSQRLKDLKAKAGPLSNDDLKQAVDVLGMPAFPMSRAEARALLAKLPAGTDEKGKVQALLNEANARDPGFGFFQKQSSDTDKFSEPLILPDWPFSVDDWQAIMAPPPPPPPAPPPAPQPIPASANHQAVMKELIARESDRQSDTADGGSDPIRFPEGFSRPVEAWLAEPSRLAFAVKTTPIPWTLKALTGWDRFDLRVIQRAKRAFEPTPDGADPSKKQEPARRPAQVLDEQGIPKDDKSPKNRMKAIAAAMRPPTPYETALEIPTGLILSPAQDTRWITPNPLPDNLKTCWGDAGPPTVWQARMIEALKTPSLRAVWSIDLKEGKLPFGPYRDDPHPDRPFPEKWTANGGEYRTALSPQDRAELVTLTSVYGLPVIPAGKDEKDGRDKASSQVIAPPEYKIDADGDTAVYMPVGLKTKRLALGATGAMLDLDTTFPAITAVNVGGKSLFDSLSLQRWRSLINDGSDVVTTVVRRGYLFPLGHKASLVKVTEPRIRPIDPRRPSLGYSVEQATRIFIEVTRATHNYPAVSQNNGGRSHQPHDITLLTLRTPDLIDASDDRPLKDFAKDAALDKIADAVALKTPLVAGQHGSIRGWIDQGDKLSGPVPGRMVGKVFWPRTEVGARGTVRFRMRIDKGSAPVSMPLIFVDHTAASDRATMEALCTRYYNGEAGANADKPKDWNKVQHNGALRTYADEQRQGQCTFATDWQLIHAEGGGSNFYQNIALLAAEQPPFYPKMARAQIRPQQIQGLTGSAAPAIEVAYGCDYEKFGFNPPPNMKIADPDTFLVVTSNPRPVLDMGDHGDQGGTVARKSMEICGLNRRFGLAGPPLRGCTAVPEPPADATLGAAPAAAAAAPAAGAVIPTMPPPITAPPAPLPIVKKCDASSEPEKKSYPEDLALGHFGGDAKLFGLIKLSDFIKLIAAASGKPIGEDLIPQLEEITSFTGDALGRVAGALLDPVELLQDQVNRNGGQLIFPDFAAALSDLQCELVKAKGGTLNPAQQIDSATKIWSSGQQVARELDAIARTPLAEISGRLHAQFIRSFGTITEQISRFAPWVVLQEKLAELVADIAATRPDAMITVALTNAPGNQIAAKVAAVVKRPETWRTADPLQTIIAAVKSDPAFAAVTNLDTVIVKGVLYDFASDLVTIFQDDLTKKFDPASLSAAVAWANAAIDKALALRDQIKRFADLATTDLCNVAARSLQDFFKAIARDIYSASIPLVTDSPSKNVIDALQQIVDDITTLVEDIRREAEAAPAFREPADRLIAYLDAWKEKLVTAIGKLEKTMEATGEAWKRVATAVDNATSCASFNTGVVRAMAELNAERKSLVELWLGVVTALPNPPALPLQPPAGAPAPLLALWKDAVDKIAEVFRANAEAAMNTTLRNIASDGQASWNSFKSNLGTLAGSVPEVTQFLNDVETAVTTTAIEITNALQLPGALPADPVDLQRDITQRIQLLRNIATSFQTAEKKVLETTFRAAMSRLLGDIKPDIDRYAKVILEPIGTIYDQIGSARDLAYQTVVDRLGSGGLNLIDQLFGKPKDLPPNPSFPKGCDEDWIRFIFYLPPAPGAACDVGSKNDGLINERNALKAGTTDALKTVLDRWEKGEAAPQLIVNHVRDFAKISARAAILKVFDVEDLRQRIMDALALAVPTKRTLKSGMSLDLKTTSVGFGTFRPIGGDGKLTLNTSATIDLLKPAVPEANFEGKVSPFELDILSVMTFRFQKGVEYTKPPNDNRGRILAPLGAEDIKFGDKLSFLADLSKSLAFGGGADGSDGPYTILHIDRPSIEAGYRISIPVITLGVTFTNIHFAGAVMLPFNNGSARLRASLGSLDAPFMISAGIYGGSGFMAIEASPQGIEAFEASFEFGGIASLGYGPLQGTAYVTTGAYVRKDPTGCTFAALFSAGFTAHIACFGVSASFTLRLYKREGDSSVQGEARLTFTFSVGTFKVRYEVRVARKMQAGFGGGGKQAADNSLSGGLVQLAALGGFTPDCYPLEQKAMLHTTSFSPAESWSDFDAQFDPQFCPVFAHG